MSLINSALQNTAMNKACELYYLGRQTVAAERKQNSDDAEKEVRSKAVVKYSVALVPAPFTLLQSNTNLNLPPSNWLSNSVAVYGVQPGILTQPDFSSFSMAHKFPDCVGVVDVVSDAENIKKLMKMCFSSSPVSLMIHRVEKTLLIDDFDLKKVLLASDGCWEWFRVFFERFGKSLQVKPENVIEYKDNSRTVLQQKRLVSKFLYHSLVSSPDVAKGTDEPPKADPNIAIPLPFIEGEPQLPEPPADEELPDPASSHAFARNVVWNFEDIQMLLGTDIPIFGGGTHPCVSLRLRDMNKPINVLTGMDYWLDNLMCNVPEVMMCYHLNGIVQRYELIKTEDLPDLPNSKFSPKVIRDIAQNILSFLKSNATKAGHTYWLFKGRGDDAVKLYDLTSLCNDVLEEGQTPFTVPVAMLLYRVARNMKHQDGRNQAATICTLLKNCIKLLPAQKYPEIATSAHFMLADLFIPSDLDPRNPDLASAVSGEPQTAEPSEDEYSSFRSMSVSSMCEPQEEPLETPVASPPLSSDVFVRCNDSLKHVIMGLRCLPAIEPPAPAMGPSSEPIPMSYQSLNTKKQDAESDSPTTLCKPPGDSLSWGSHLRTLLYEKAALVYFTLVEHSFGCEEYGASLRYCAMSMRMISLLTSHRISTFTECALFGKAGDVLLMIATRVFPEMQKHDEAFRKNNEVDSELLLLITEEGKTETPSPLPVTLDSLETLLLSSAACYSHAASLANSSERQSSYYRRLGNIENEIGVFYMNQAHAYIREVQTDETLAKVKNLLVVSQTHLDAGIAAFKKVEDAANLALLYSNTGRLMRLKAHFNSSPNATRSELAHQERIFYKKAISSYHLAMDVLGERSANPAVWDSIFWELSTAYYTMATLLQDYPAGHKSPDEAERELTETLHKALKYCDLETNGARLPIYQFRCAEIHHRLGSLHHSQFRYNNDEGRKKHILQLSKLHYEKAARLLSALEYPTELLKLQMERVGLSELLAEGSSVANAKVKHYLQCLEYIVESIPILELLASGNDKYEIKEREEQVKVLSLMLQRLQFILLSLTKLTMKRSEDKKSALGGKSCQLYKELYSRALACCASDKEEKSVEDLAKGILTVALQAQKSINFSADLTR